MAAHVIRYASGDECNYFSWFDEEEGTKWQTRAWTEARDEIWEKDIVIEKLKKPFQDREMKIKL
ncbi:unnamed protein product [Eruca vesicaria subsp. sativa]|uniref:Uncharacterized protein n=1 Tax=Eruca vesicaria subsp. sativa TaxID=29727 RepID=A0ABC8MA42_ERUVS|nr:unnamed protein product [Eruca vesicaria subsp. sativa]